MDDGISDVAFIHDDRPVFPEGSVSGVVSFHITDDLGLFGGSHEHHVPGIDNPDLRGGSVLHALGFNDRERRTDAGSLPYGVIASDDHSGEDRYNQNEVADVLLHGDREGISR